MCLWLSVEYAVAVLVVYTVAVFVVPSCPWCPGCPGCPWCLCLSVVSLGMGVHCGYGAGMMATAGVWKGGGYCWYGWPLHSVKKWSIRAELVQTV